MKDMNVRANEVEEIEAATEVEETSESSNTGALLAGIAGGVIAYAAISATMKLQAVVRQKWAAWRRNAEIADAVPVKEVKEVNLDAVFKS